ncbi:hypothetical protein ERX35_010155 [Macrococcus equipercicus]|uniref:Knr4/Smi1-like domain-containing protein n=1 Tax=Macrococcus equipercicus TaxID=69967 RepID=A0ABQ6R6G3_9STAP|nr:SMI1/KNR4 family protein [Macrococcus equipercicus]KAA1036884.1 hypothetical protein ERX35_010155 [Macrococcus equipercicus]
MDIKRLFENDKVYFAATLNPGATDEEIEALVEVFKAPLDEQFVALYREADGESYDSVGLFFGLEWLPLEEVIREVEFNQDEAEEIAVSVVPEGAIKEEYYHELWLPFATDGFGNFLAVDTDPGETGTKGQVITYGSDLETMYVVAESLNDFLVFIERTIDTDQYHIDEDGRFHYGQDEVLFFDKLKDMALPLKG